MLAPNIRKARKAKQDRSAFATLIDTPAFGSFTMPANGRIRFVVASGFAAGDLLATLVGPFKDQDPNSGTYGDNVDRLIKSPGLNANQHLVIDRLEKGVEITPETQVNVELDVGLGRWARIGEN